MVAWGFFNLIKPNYTLFISQSYNKKKNNMKKIENIGEIVRKNLIYFWNRWAITTLRRPFYGRYCQLLEVQYLKPNGEVGIIEGTGAYLKTGRTFTKIYIPGGKHYNWGRSTEIVRSDSITYINIGIEDLEYN